MNIDCPSKIELTDEEEKLLALINFDPSPFNRELQETRQSSSDAAEKLTVSICSRNAILEIRWQYFTNQEYNIGSKKSRKQIFEQNGTRGKDIFKHPHFLKFLRYFIFGPQLPPPVIEEFWYRVVHLEADLRDLRQFSRNATRENCLKPGIACEEFHKLALECGLSEYIAREVRDDVRRVR